MKITRLYLIKCLILLPMIASAQLSSDVDNIYNSVRDFDANSIGENSELAIQVKFENGLAQISGIASDQELVHIAHTGNAALKQYAIGTLIDRQSATLIPLFSDFVTVNEPFTLRLGDKLHQTNAAIELYKGIASQKDRLLRKQYYERTVTATELGELRTLFGREFDTKWSTDQADSLLFVFDRIAMSNDSIATETLNAILRTNGFAATDYERAKFYANRTPTPEILAALAKFKNTSDIAFIVANFDLGLPAVTQFPHPLFFPQLQSRLSASFEVAEFQQAVASYKNVHAAKMLDLICDKIALRYRDRDQRAQKLLELYNIIESNHCKPFDAVLKKLQRY